MCGLGLYIYVEKEFVSRPTIPFDILRHPLSLIGYLTNFVHGMVVLTVGGLPCFLTGISALLTLVTQSTICRVGVTARRLRPRKLTSLTQPTTKPAEERRQFGAELTSFLSLSPSRRSE